jgi:protocatechuate 3,4-dioxygenase beta subunit
MARTPKLPFVPVVPDRRPGFDLARVIEPSTPVELDLTRVRPTAPRAIGQLIQVTGRVEDAAGRPVRHAVLEIWQANAGGKYRHELDPSPVPLDPAFEGAGRITTDAEGRYRLLTIKPGAYAVPYEERGGAINWWRPPHIHFSIFGPGFSSRLVTQMYFPGEPLNEPDLLLNSIPSGRARALLVARFGGPLAPAGEPALTYRHDFVLGGGRDGTPFEDR